MVTRQRRQQNRHIALFQLPQQLVQLAVALQVQSSFTRSLLQHLADSPHVIQIPLNVSPSLQPHLVAVHIALLQLPHTQTASTPTSQHLVQRTHAHLGDVAHLQLLLHQRLNARHRDLVLLLEKALERPRDPRLEPLLQRAQQPYQYRPVQRLAHAPNQLHVHLARLPEALEVAVVHVVRLLHLGQKRRIAATAAQVAQQQGAVKPAMNQLLELLTGGVAAESGLVRLGTELRAVHDELLLNADSLGDATIRLVQRLEQLRLRRTRRCNAFVHVPADGGRREGGRHEIDEEEIGLERHVGLVEK